MEHVLAITSIQFLSNGKERSDKKRGWRYFGVLSSTSFKSFITVLSTVLIGPTYSQEKSGNKKK